jgi:hypothetical protein
MGEDYQPRILLPRDPCIGSGLVEEDCSGNEVARIFGQRPINYNRTVLGREYVAGERAACTSSLVDGRHSTTASSPEHASSGHSVLAPPRFCFSSHSQTFGLL